MKDLGEEGEETSEINALKQFSRNDLEFIVQCAHEPNVIFSTFYCTYTGPQISRGRKQEKNFHQKSPLSVTNSS